MKYVRQLLLGLGTVLFVCGCGGDSHMQVYPVSGRVTVNGDPAGGAELVFFGVDETLKSADAPMPKAYTDPEGNFQVGSYDLSDGAPAGEYRVTVVWRPSDSADPERRDMEPDALQGKYSDPETTPLRVTVERAPNQLQPFEL